jgi:VWFA-related protein
MRQRNKRIIAATAAAVACVAGTLFAQTLESTGTVIRTDVRLVVLHTTVVDKSGHLVMDLPQKAFTVYENGVSQEIKKFRREDVPVSMGLIVDNSGSMREKRARVEAAALALVKESNPEDEAFVVNFNDEAFLDLPPGEEFTNNVQHMEEALTRIDARGGTALFDSIRMSIEHARSKGHKDKKVLVVVTDGNDNQSVITLESLVKLAQQSEVLIYAVGLLGDEERREAAKAQRALKELATATGGEAFFPREVSEVDRIAHQVARDIRSQYIIQYTPKNAAMDGTYRQIKVAVNAPGRPTVRTRTGYYATPDREAPAPSAASSFKQ